MSSGTLEGPEREQMMGSQMNGYSARGADERTRPGAPARFTFDERHDFNGGEHVSD